MKKVNKSSIPNALLNYRSTNKSYTWKAFRKKKKSYKRVKKQIFKDQGGICAYCEQDFSCSQGDDDYITQMI